MANCISDVDCSPFGIRMSCINEECGCDIEHYILLEIENHWVKRGCYPKAKLFTSCIISEQCIAMNRNTYCNRNNRCTCSPGYYFDGRDCIIRYDTNLKAQEVYKAAVVAAACFIVAVVGIFVACIVRRSFCRREGNVQHSSSSSSDVFSVSDEIAALRAVDKPPSYEEVLQIERTFYGIPPPEYSFVRDRDCDQQYNQNTVEPCETNNSNQWDQTCFQHNEHITDNHVSSAEGFSSATLTTAVINSSANVPAVSSESPSVATTLNSNAIASEDVTLSSAYPFVLRPELLNNSLPLTPPWCSSESLGLRLSSSASAPSSPRLVARTPTTTHRGGLLQRISSLKLYPTRPVVPTDQSAGPSTASPDTINNRSPIGVNVGGMNTGCSSSFSTSHSSLTAYDNPAFVSDQK